jgi:hypothetical protein
MVLLLFRVKESSWSPSAGDLLLSLQTAAQAHGQQGRRQFINLHSSGIRIKTLRIRNSEFFNFYTVLNCTICRKTRGCVMNKIVRFDLFFCKIVSFHVLFSFVIVWLPFESN